MPTMGFSQKVTDFFRSVVRSCYDLEFYRHVRTRPVVSALAYVAAFHLLLSLVFSLSVVPPGALSLSRKVSEGVSERLPPGGGFEVRDGRFSTDLPPGTEFTFGDTVIVVDQTVEGSEFPQSFADRFGVLIGRDSFFVRQPDGHWETVPVSDLPDWSVTRERIQDWISAWKWPAIIAVTILAVAVMFVSGVAFLLVHALVAALPMFLLGRLWRLKLTFAQWLAVGLYAGTLPTLLDHVFSSLSLWLPFATAVVFLMLLLAVGLDERSRPTAPIGEQKDR